MSKVDAFSIPGYELTFVSNDHMPPHFHVQKKGWWNIRVYFLTSQKKMLDFNLKWEKKGKPTAAEKKMILAEVLAHREKLLEEWERKVCVKERMK